MLAALGTFRASADADIFSEQTGYDAQHYQRQCGYLDVSATYLLELVDQIYDHGINRPWPEGAEEATFFRQMNGD